MKEGLDINYSSKSDRNSLDSNSKSLSMLNQSENEKEFKLVKMGMINLFLKVRNSGN